MSGEIADEIEMRGKARLGQHAPGVAADREHLAALDQMMPVEFEGVGLLRHGSLVDHRLEGDGDALASGAVVRVGHRRVAGVDRVAADAHDLDIGAVHRRPVDRR